VSDHPSLDLERTRDLVGREENVWVRRVLLVIFALISLFALLNGVGQRSSEVSVAGPAAGLEVRSPARVRGGLLFQARFRIRARRAIGTPRLVLGAGWFDGLTLNTVEPAAAQEKSRDGGVELAYPTIDAGQVFSLYLDYQVNPTTVGTRKQRVELYDGSRLVTALQRDVTVLP
jgi:hypothetical protein